MTDFAILAKDITVRFKPYLDHTPTLRRSLGRLRHRTPSAVVALDDVSFDVAKGEAFGIVGANGAGKSTLLRVLAGTLQPDAGTIETQGRTSTLLQLGVGFNIELSGRRNVYLGGLAAGLRREAIDRLYDAIVAYAGLEDAIDRPLKTYSSGMFSRLAFSIAMHIQPDILLLDEVLAVGDEAFQKKSLAAMRELVARSGTIVFVSHNLNSVVEFCDRAMWLDAGTIRGLGPAREVVERYRRSVIVTPSAPAPKREGGPWSANEKVEAVLRLMRGDPVDLILDDLACDAARLEQWRSDFVRAGREQFKPKPPPPS